MMVIAATPPSTDAGQKATGAVRAPWSLRAAALAVDILPGAVGLAVTALVALSVPLYGGWWWVCATTGAVALLLTAANRLLLPIICGNSLGRAAFGIMVMHRNAEPVGPWLLLLRDMAHVLDTSPMFAGWFWPLWDSRRRTFADILLCTESRLVETRRRGRYLRRLLAAFMLTAALLCAVGVTISYTVVHQHDRSVAVAGAQVAAQGPRMVAKMLSYHPETIQADFDHARSLATDKYGVELSALQQAVQESGPVRNEYWVSNSAVLDAAPERATMLLFLQGERGAPPDQRYITASVRATFVASGAAGWRVDDIAVIAGTPAPEAQP